MRKSSKAHSQRGLNRHNKNVRRKKRVNELNKFNGLVGLFKHYKKLMDESKESNND